MKKHHRVNAKKKSTNFVTNVILFSGIEFRKINKLKFLNYIMKFMFDEGRYSCHTDIYL